MALRSLLPDLPQSSVTLTYLRDLEGYTVTKPYHISGSLPASQEFHRTNICYEAHSAVPLRNLRGQEQELDIAIHGFQIVTIDPEVVSLDVQGSGKEAYIEAMTKSVKELLGAEFAICYDCRFRSSQRIGLLDPEDPAGMASRPDVPAEAAHIDLTRAGANKRARRHLTGDEHKRYVQSGMRLRMINVWRPLSKVYDYDLLYCDHTTVKSEDLIAVDRVSSEYVGEVYMLKPRPHYEWYWMDHQDKDEATFFVSYDSHPGASAPCRFCRPLNRLDDRR